MSTLSKLTLLTLLGSFVGIGTAGANPIMIDLSVALQVPETFHVQVSYLCDFQECNWPIGVERGGEPIGAEWIGPTAIEINGGSGLDYYDAMQMCDCDVPVGAHMYKILFEPDVEIYTRTEIEVTVTDPPPDPPDPPDEADVDDEDINPWDIPEQPWPKGLSCAEWCDSRPDPELTPDPVPDEEPDVISDTGSTTDTGTTVPDTGPPADTGSAASDPAPDTGSTTETTTMKGDEGGSCSTASGHSEGLVLLCVIVSAIGLLRRRRAW